MGGKTLDQRKGATHALATLFIRLIDKRSWTYISGLVHKISVGLFVECRLRGGEEGRENNIKTANEPDNYLHLSEL